MAELSLEGLIKNLENDKVLAEPADAVNLIETFIYGKTSPSSYNGIPLISLDDAQKYRAIMYDVFNVAKNHVSLIKEICSKAVKDKNLKIPSPTGDEKISIDAEVIKFLYNNESIYKIALQSVPNLAQLEINCIVDDARSSVGCPELARIFSVFAFYSMRGMAALDIALTKISPKVEAKSSGLTYKLLVRKLEEDKSIDNPVAVANFIVANIIPNSTPNITGFAAITGAEVNNYMELYFNLFKAAEKAALEKSGKEKLSFDSDVINAWFNGQSNFLPLTLKIDDKAQKNANTLIEDSCVRYNAFPLSFFTLAYYALLGAEKLKEAFEEQRNAGRQFLT